MVGEVVGGLRPRPGARLVDATVGSRRSRGGAARRRARRRSSSASIAIPTRSRSPAHDSTASRDARRLRHGTLRRSRGGARGRRAGTAPTACCSTSASARSSSTIAARGFSFRPTGPLDMRMDPAAPLDRGGRSSTPGTRATLAPRHRASYGEEPRARAVARAIVRARPLATHGASSRDVVARVVGRGRPGPAPGDAHVPGAPHRRQRRARRARARSSPTAGTLLGPGGRLAILAYHSLEDRRVKEAFRRWAASLPLPAGPARLRAAAGRPRCACCTPRPLRPTAEEIGRESARAQRAAAHRRARRPRVTTVVSAIERMRRTARRGAPRSCPSPPARAPAADPGGCVRVDAQPASSRRVAGPGRRAGAALPRAGVAPPAGGRRRLRAVGRAADAAAPRARAAASSRSSSRRSSDPRRARRAARADGSAWSSPEQGRWWSSGDGAARPPRAHASWSRSLLVGVLRVLLARAVDLTVLRGPEFARQAAGQHRTARSRSSRIAARSSIATASCSRSRSTSPRSTCARASSRDERARRSPTLARALDLPAPRGAAQVAQPQPFVWLKRQALPRRARRRRSARRSRASATSTSRAAFYPHGSLAAHVLGFVGIDSQGLAGLERRFDARSAASRCASPSIATRAAASSSARRAGRADAGQPRRAHARRRASRPSTERELAAGVGSGARRSAARRWCSIR